MLKFNYGTGGDADDREMIQGNLCCPVLVGFKKQIISKNIPGFGAEPHLNIMSDSETLKRIKVTPHVIPSAARDLAFSAGDPSLRSG